MAGRAPDTLTRSGDWTDLAICKGYDEEFFSDSVRLIKWAKARCGRCPVQPQCLADTLQWEAIRGNVPYGVAGGWSAAERKDKAKREAAEAAASPVPAPVAKAPRPRLAPCGTDSAYNRHVRKREPIDAACRQARREADRRFRNTGTTKVLV